MGTSPQAELRQPLGEAAVYIAAELDVCSDSSPVKSQSQGGDSGESRPPVSAATSLSSVSWAAGETGVVVGDWSSLHSIGRFTVLRFLGQGGMGVVFLVRENKLDAGSCGENPLPALSIPGPSPPELALKLLRPEFSGRRTAIERFLKEATHMQRLRHACILPVFAYGESELGPWFTMPYRERGPLDQLLRAKGPLSTNTVLEVALDIASALAHAHHHGLVHRDVKPANVLLTCDGHAQLADFGLAHTLFNDSLLDIRSGIVAGTPRYQPPNALRGQYGDTRDDLWSYGVLLYELLTGKVPYPGTTREEVLRQIESGPPAPPVRVNPEANEGLARIVLKAIAPELADRYASMDYVLEDLQRVRSGQPINPPKQPELGSRRKGARKRLLVVASIVAFVGLGFFAASVLKPKPPAAVKVLSGAQPPSDPPGTLVVEHQCPLPSTLPVQDILVGNFRSHREPTLFFPDDGKLSLVSLNGQTVDSCSDTTIFSRRDVFLADTDSDGLCEVFAGFHTQAGLSIAVFNQNLFLTKVFQHPGSGMGPEWQSSASNRLRSCILVTDLDNDGHRELLCQVGRSLPPVGRGVWCFDYEECTWKWAYATGATLTAIAAEDLDHDGHKEIILSSAGTSNGGRGETGMNDAVSRVCVLSHDGMLRWEAIVGAKLSLARVRVGDIDNDGRSEIVAWEAERHTVWESLSTSTNGMVMLFDGSGHVIGSRNLGIPLRDGHLADLDNDGSPEFIVFDYDGNVHVLDRGLASKGRPINIVPRRYGRVLLNLVGVADLTDDGVAEWVLTSRQEKWLSGRNHGDPSGESVRTTLHDIEILVLNRDFSVCGRHVLWESTNQGEAESVHLADCNGDGKPEILVLARDIQVLTCRRRQ